MIRIRKADWHLPADRRALEDIRRRVFIEEQGVPEALEWEAADATARHFLAETEDRAVGCARLLPSGRIGRMAVLPPWRGHGIGRALLEACEAAAREAGLPCVQLAAQVQALDFYLAAGYEPVMPLIFLDAGIPHQELVKQTGALPR